MSTSLPNNQRIVITGVGLDRAERQFAAGIPRKPAGRPQRRGSLRYSLFRAHDGRGLQFRRTAHQKRKDIRRGTRAAGIGIYYAHEAIADAGLDWPNVEKSRVGIYVGVTEHGNVETENEMFLIKGYDYDTQYWSHHHNPRTVANNPAGEISLNLGITGPHYTLGAACAAGNAGLIQGVQMLRLGDCDLALSGGVSESIRTFGIFASFNSQGALAKHEDPTKASRPFDLDRNGIVVAEGGCMYVLERISDAQARGANLRRNRGLCDEQRRDRFCPARPRAPGRVHPAGVAAGRDAPDDVDIVSTHATGTTSGDIQECKALRQVLDGKRPHRVQQHEKLHRPRDGGGRRLELAGNLPAFDDGVCHPTINLDHLDPECACRI